MLGFLPLTSPEGVGFSDEKEAFSEERIVFALRQAESGTSVAEVIRKLKQLVADLSLDKKMLQDVLSKNTLSPAVKRVLVRDVRVAYRGWKKSVQVRKAGSWACPATGPAWLTLRLVPRWGRRQPPGIVAPEVASFKWGRSHHVRCPSSTARVSQD